MYSWSTSFRREWGVEILRLNYPKREESSAPEGRTTVVEGFWPLWDKISSVEDMMSSKKGVGSSTQQEFIGHPSQKVLVKADRCHWPPNWGKAILWGKAELALWKQASVGPISGWSLREKGRWHVNSQGADFRERVEKESSRLTQSSSSPLSTRDGRPCSNCVYLGDLFLLSVIFYIYKIKTEPQADKKKGKNDCSSVSSWQL